MIARFIARLVHSVIERRAQRNRQQLGQLPRSWKAHPETIVNVG